MVAWVGKERCGLGLEWGKEVPQREVSSLQTMLPAWVWSCGVFCRFCCRSWRQASLGNIWGHLKPIVSGKHPRLLLVGVTSRILFQCIGNESILSESGDPECLFSRELNLYKELNKTYIWNPNKCFHPGKYVLLSFFLTRCYRNRKLCQVILFFSLTSVTIYKMTVILWLSLETALLELP